jgi:N-acetylglucosamine kinase-like BadF-type ATPase
MKYFLGIDGGGTKTHALVADETGQAVGFARGGTGTWEAVGYDGLTETLRDVSRRALDMAGLRMEQITGTGLGLAGYDWPSQKQAHLEALANAGLRPPLQLVNDVALGISAGAEAGWGISIGSGTGCNCRGRSKDHQREGRVVGGANHWSGEAAGGFDILLRAMRAVSFEWTRRGPPTALTPAFIEHVGAKDLDDLVEGAYVGRFDFDPSLIMLIFEVARAGDPQAVDVMRWAGQELGGMAVGVINQLDLHKEDFDVVLIGSIFDGHPAIQESVGETVHRVAPGARLVRLNLPPVVGGVVLGMEAAGVDFRNVRARLIETTEKLLSVEQELT